MTNKNHGMLEPFESYGRWWREAGTAVNGKFTFDPQKGIRVYLSGGIGSVRTNDGIGRLDVIYGELDDGTKITLLDCVQALRRHSIAMSKRFQFVLTARKCLVGAHVTSDFKFNKFYVSIDNFFQFMCRLAIRPVENGYGIIFERVDPSKLNIGDSEVTVTLVPNRNSQWFSNSHTITLESVIKIKPKLPVEDLDQVILGEIRTLKSMLDFSLGYPVGITSLKAVYTSEHEQQGSIEILYSQVAEKTDKEIVPMHDMLFSFCGRFDGDIADLVNRWNAFYKDNRFTVDTIIYSGVKGTSTKKPEQSFFLLIASLEALHSRYGKNQKTIPDEIFQNVMKSLNCCVPDSKYRGFIESKIKQMNGISLRNRLVEVLNELTGTVISSQTNKEILITNLVRYRNAIAHHHRAEDLDVLAVWQHAELLWGITVSYVLKILRFSDEEIREIANRNINMMNSLRWLGQYLNPVE